MIALAFMVIGFVLVVVGVALWSVPAACIIAGALLFISGGYESLAAPASTTPRGDASRT